jgi:hypothetical protein
VSDFAERGTWKPEDVEVVVEYVDAGIYGELVSEAELETLSDSELVALIVSRSSLDEESAREALSIIRGGPPEGVTYERDAER